MKFLFPFCIAALSVVRPSIPTCLLSVQPLVFLLLTGTSGLAGIDAASDVTAEDIKATNLRGSAEPLPVESIVRRQTQELLGDWALCSASDQCINGCCSIVYSEGILKCTPLENGFQSDICFSQGQRLGDWELCSASDQCINGCCSSRYSHDNLLRCTPLDNGYQSDICLSPWQRLGDWVQCSASDQCINGCCSSMYSEGILKCTPLDNGFQSDICISWTNGGGTCGNGYVGDGRCSDGSCCSIYGWCGTGTEHCSGDDRNGGEGSLPVPSPTMSPTGMLPVPVPPTTSNDSFSDFCWKNSYGRGVGTIPNTCPSDREQRGLLCYSKCPEGFQNPPGTVDCHQLCPDGFRDDGMFCRRSEYGRGAGYAWQDGDPLFSAAGQFGRCHNDHGNGNCEQNGAIVYPKCAEGYSPFGCCICRPNTPDCAALGFEGQLDLSCTKKMIMGDPTLMGCGDGLEYNVGLCYPPCAEGYHGVGPVCWGQPPSGWVHCGFGAARDFDACTEALKNQVLSVTDTALFVASLGASSATRPMQKGTQEYYNLLEQIQKLREMVDLVLGLEEQRPEALMNNLATWREDVEKYNIADMEPEDLFRLIAELVSEFDESGIASIFAAYLWPVCSNIVG